MALVVISGISRGIGKAIAQRFDQENYTIIGCSVNPDSVHHIQKEFPHWHVSVVDVRQSQAIKSWAASVLEKHGVPNVLINNAGKYLPGQVHQEEDAVFFEMLESNLHSAYFMSKAFANPMKKVKPATIINIASIAGIQAYPNGGSYSISKFGMVGLSKALREELKPDGIRVCTLLPGAVLTDSWAGVELPKDRFMQVEDIAEAAWLCHSLPSTTVIEEMILRPQLGDI